LRLQAIAVERGLTESAVLKCLVVGAIGMAPASDATVLSFDASSGRFRNGHSAAAGPEAALQLQTLPTKKGRINPSLTVSKTLLNETI